MTVARSVAEVLDQHVDFEVECIDRMYLGRVSASVAAPARGGRLPAIPPGVPVRLDRAGGPDQQGLRRGHPPGSPPSTRWRWWTSPEASARTTWPGEYLAGFTAEEGVLFIGRAQEKTGVFRTEKRRNAEGAAYPWIVRSTGVVNHFYVYAVDADFGPFFLSEVSHFLWFAMRPPRARRAVG